MAVLTDSQIDDYCNRHLPYIRGVMLAHYVLIARGPYKDDARILNATFLGSLIAGRMILEFLGVGLDQSKMEAQRPPGKKSDSVWIDDLGGDLVQIATLRSQTDKHRSICEYIKMAHKAAGHLTVAEDRPHGDLHPMLKIIDELFRTQMQTVPRLPSPFPFDELIP